MTPEARDAMENAGFSRRDLLGGFGALVVGFCPERDAPGAAAQVTSKAVDVGQVDSWIAIGVDGVVTAFTGKCEFGQGFRTVQYQLEAEELSNLRKFVQ